MGDLAACGVEPSRIAHVEHTFETTDYPSTGRGHEEHKGSAEPEEYTPPPPQQQQVTRGSSGDRNAAVVGPEPSAEWRQSLEREDEIVGVEDTDEVRARKKREPGACHMIAYGWGLFGF